MRSHDFLLQEEDGQLISTYGAHEENETDASDLRQFAQAHQPDREGVAFVMLLKRSASSMK